MKFSGLEVRFLFRGPEELGGIDQCHFCEQYREVLEQECGWCFAHEWLVRAKWYCELWTHYSGRYGPEKEGDEELVAAARRLCARREVDTEDENR